MHRVVCVDSGRIPSSGTHPHSTRSLHVHLVASSRVRFARVIDISTTHLTFCPGTCVPPCHCHCSYSHGPVTEVFPPPAPDGRRLLEARPALFTACLGCPVTSYRLVGQSPRVLPPKISCINTRGVRHALPQVTGANFRALVYHGLTHVSCRLSCHPSWLALWSVCCFVHTP